MTIKSLSCLCVAALSMSCALAQSPAPVTPASKAHPRLPVREITVFKDGHAFVLREDDLAPDAGDEIVLDDLPAPVLGTFWPYANGGAKLVSAKAAKIRVEVERTALSLRQLLEANVGRDALVVDTNAEHTQGTIVGLPRRSGEELERVDPQSERPRLPEAGSLVLVRTAEGTKAIPLDRVRDVTFLGEPKAKVVDEELRDRLTVRVERSAGAADQSAKIGIVYVQKGLRWIPAYEVDIDGAGKMKVALEATLVDDLVDLSDATVNLVVGVPHFEFAGHVDPIALQETAAILGRQMQMADPMSNYLSNSIMTQSARYSTSAGRPESSAAPEITGAESNEDLFVFTVRHVTLRRGERLVLPITSFTLDYRDVYTLDLPFAPPVELRDSFPSDRMGEIARLLTAPKAMHTLRLANKSSAPLTTAPALVLEHGKVIAQGLMTYTPIGAESDLPLTAAIDVSVAKSEKEAGRTPNAVNWNNEKYSRIDMTGSVELVNQKDRPVDIEVRRTLMGLADSIDGAGKLEQKSLSEVWLAADRPSWWSWWNWPTWWQHWNGIASATWKLRLEPGAKATLNANWHYFWR